MYPAYNTNPTGFRVYRFSGFRVEACLLANGFNAYNRGGAGGGGEGGLV